MPHRSHDRHDRSALWAGAVLLVTSVEPVAYAGRVRIDIQEPGEPAGPTRPHHLADLEYPRPRPSTPVTDR